MSTGVRLGELEGGVKELSCFTAEVELASSFTTAASLLVSASSPQGLKMPPCCPTALRPPLAMLGDIIHWASHVAWVDFVQLKCVYFVHNFGEHPIEAPKSNCACSSRPPCALSRLRFCPPSPHWAGEGPRASNRGAQPPPALCTSVCHCSLVCM